MATLYGSTGAKLNDGINVALDDIEARLIARGYDVSQDGISYIPGDEAPQFEPVMEWPEYLLLQVYDSEPRTKVFRKSGFYHLRKISARDADFLLKP